MVSFNIEDYLETPVNMKQRVENLRERIEGTKSKMNICTPLGGGDRSGLIR